MDLIREHLIYKNVPTTICLKSLTPAEHYEVIRCLLATRTNNVSICCSECSNIFIQILLKKLPIQLAGTCSKAGNSTEGNCASSTGGSNGVTSVFSGC